MAEGDWENETTVWSCTLKLVESEVWISLVSVFIEDKTNRFTGS